MMLTRAKRISTTLLFATMVTLSSGTLVVSHNALAENQSLVRNKTGSSLPREQIKRFVTAIAVIKHYYIKKTTDNKLFANAIRGMVSALDPHSTFYDEDDLKDLKTTVSGKFVGVGIELTTQNGALKVISPLEGTPAFRAGVKPNDLIIKVNGKLVSNMTLRDAVRNIKGERGTKVTLTILRKDNKKPLSLVITRDTINLVTVKKKMLESGYGYVRITFFQGPVANALHEAINSLKKESGGQLKGLVLDLRNNPGGLLDVSGEVANTFLDSKSLQKYNGLIVYTKGRIKGSDMKLKASPGDMIKGVPMVVLINGGTASASEIVAGALQDYKRAVLLGTRTFGKGSVQTVLPIGPESAVKLTTALYYTPSGRVIQAKGIQPNVDVPELVVNEKNVSNLLDFDESDYKNHIINNTKPGKDKQSQINQHHSKEMKLAQKDYQLYEALLLLKGMHAMK